MPLQDFHQARHGADTCPLSYCHQISELVLAEVRGWALLVGNSPPAHCPRTQTPPSPPRNPFCLWATGIGIISYFYCNITPRPPIPSLISWLLPGQPGLLTALKKQNEALMGFCEIRELCPARSSGTRVGRGRCRAEQNQLGDGATGPGFTQISTGWGPGPKPTKEKFGSD